jgi:hypothetical protein
LDQFIDITIAEFDDKASEPSGRGALQRLVLRLSQSAPGEWADYFNQAWSQHLYDEAARVGVRQSVANRAHALRRLNQTTFPK